MISTSRVRATASAPKKSGKEALLEWFKQKTEGYKGCNVTNFSRSFADGLVFCAVMHNFFPSKIPYDELTSESQERNFTLAFKCAEEASIPSFLDVEDMVAMARPDPLSVMTYCSQIYKKFGNR